MSQNHDKKLDINVVKTQILKDVVRLLSPDRCYFRVYDNEQKIFFSVDNEYLISNDVESITYYVYTREANDYSLSIYSEKGEFIISDVEAFIEENKFSNSHYIISTIKVFKEQKIKSFYGIALYDKDKIIGCLELQYVRDKVLLSHEQIDLLKNILAKHQSDLKDADFSEFQKYAIQKEKVIREITDRSFLLNNEYDLFGYLLPKIVRIFDIDGAMFVEAPKVLGTNPNIKYEYQNDMSYGSFIGGVFPQECIKTYTHMLSTMFPVVVNDTENFYAEDEGRQCFYRELCLKAFLTVPIVTETLPRLSIGAIILFSRTPRIWLKNEIDLMRHINDIAIRMIDKIKRTKDVEELRKSFIQTMMHDLQVPLVGATTALDFLLNTSDDTPIGKVKYLIEELKNSNSSLYEALDKYIEIYHYESGERKLYKHENHIFPFLNQSLQPLRPSIEARKIELDIDIEDTLNTLDFDELEIFKVLQVFLNNAIDYSPKGSKVKIKIRENESEFTFCVEDNGIGVKKELQDKLFDRMYMIERTQRKVGSGLNLYLCKLIVEAHGGHIWHESPQEQGAKFCFSLPKTS